MLEQFNKTAFHESGHIVMTYFSEYSVDECEILGNGDGKTTMNYGQDLLLIAAVTNCKNNPEIFNDLPPNLKIKSAEIAFKATLVLLGGSIAECIYLNNGIVEGDMNVEISGPDLIRVENIHFLLSQINKNHKPHFIPDTMQNVLVTFSIPEFWSAITNLAESIVGKEDMKLSKYEIESILSECGFFDHLKQYR